MARETRTTVESISHASGKTTPQRTGILKCDSPVAVAVWASGAVGIDVERPRLRDFAALAEQAFGPQEIAEVAAGTAAAFYRIWTLREAMAKATGAGLALALNRHDLAEAMPSGMPSGTTTRRHRAGQDWALFHTTSVPGGDLAVAWLGGTVTHMPAWVDIARTVART